MAQICKVNSGILVFNFQLLFSDSTEEMTPVNCSDNKTIHCQVYKVFSFKEVIEYILLLVAHHIAPNITEESLQKCLDSGLDVVSILENILAVAGQDRLRHLEGEDRGEVLHTSEADRPQRPHLKSFHHCSDGEDREEDMFTFLACVLTSH